jgi:hypothetical protein
MFASTKILFSLLLDFSAAAKSDDNILFYQLVQGLG